jgi:hypothetical protein
MEHLYNWLFHYNHHEEKWYAFLRDDVKDYFNEPYPKAIKARTIEVLVEIIKRAEGKHENINSILNE